MSLGADLMLGEDGDLLLENGDMVMRSDLAQAIRIRILFFSGEWFLDTSVGIPYFEEIFAKQVNAENIAAIYRDEISKVPGVIQVLSCTAIIDRQTRHLSVSWRVLADEGEIAAVTGVV